MKEERNSVITWIKDHKKELIIAGIGVAAAILVVLAIKNRKELESTFATFKRAIKNQQSTPSSTLEHPATKCVSQISPVSVTTENNIVPLTRCSHFVKMHTKKLPAGHKASAEKIAQALELGMDLPEGQTIVNAYTTRGNVAA